MIAFNQHLVCDVLSPKLILDVHYAIALHHVVHRVAILAILDYRFFWSQEADPTVRDEVVYQLIPLHFVLLMQLGNQANLLEYLRPNLISHRLLAYQVFHSKVFLTYNH